MSIYVCSSSYNIFFYFVQYKSQLISSDISKVKSKDRDLSCVLIYTVVEVVLLDILDPY